ncbi:MAG: hypothetical protein K8L91_15865 [Anaerolineae bacterium]|nr:hypothetical protein [Anaerolineae bacterium]
MLFYSILFFCRLSISFTFIISFISKVSNILLFSRTIESFHIIPKRLSFIFAIILLTGEALVPVFLLIGKNFQIIGFVLAGFLLLLFLVALLITLRRNLKISCNCFGFQDKNISSYSILRNIVLICSSVLGVIISIVINSNLSMSIIYIIFLSFFSVAFTLILLNLEEISQIFTT